MMAVKMSPGAALVLIGAPAFILGGLAVFALLLTGPIAARDKAFDDFTKEVVSLIKEQERYRCPALPPAVPTVVPPVVP